MSSRVLLVTLICCCLLPWPVQAQIDFGWMRREFRLFRVYPRLDRAERFFSEGRYTEARTMLEQATAIDPTFIQAQRLLIETCTNLQDFDCAIERARAILDLPAGSSIGAYYLMLDAERRGNLVEAISWGEQALTNVHGQVTSEERELVFTTLMLAYQSQETSGQDITVDAEPEQFNTILSSLLDDNSSFSITTDFDAGTDNETVPAPLSRAEQIGTALRLGLIPEDLDEFLSNPANLDSLAVPEQMLWLYLLEQQNRVFQALFIARQLPENTNAHAIQSSLLEKLGRFAEAADILVAQASEEEKDDPEFWRRVVTLYGSAGMRRQQIDALYQARNLIPANTALLELTSMILMDESNLSLISGGSSPDALAQQQANLESLLASLNASGGENLIPRVDAEIALISIYLYRNQEDTAMMLINNIVNDGEFNYDQAESLAQLIWGLTGCRALLADNDAFSQPSTYGVQLLIASCYRRTGELERAVAMIDRILENPTVPEQDRQQILLQQGYILVDLQQLDRALVQWQAMLETAFDDELAVSMAYTALLIPDDDQAADLLQRIDIAQLNPSHTALFWKIRAYLDQQMGNDTEAVASYLQALSWEAGDSDTWAQLARTADRAGDINTSIQAWEGLMEIAGDNGNYRAEFAYFLQRQGFYEEAAIQFTLAAEALPQLYSLRRDLAYTQLTLGQSDDALVTLEQVIDLNLEAIDDPAGLYQDRLLYDSVRRNWNVEFNEVVRLNDNAGSFNSPAIRSSGYQGYGALNISWLPEAGRGENNSQWLDVTGRMFWSNPDKSLSAETDNLVMALGARVRLLKDHAVYASAERLFGIGDQARDDTLLRLSGSWFSGLGWPYGNQQWIRQNLYLDAAYFLESDVEYATAEYDWGPVIRLGSETANQGLRLFLRLGANANNDNLAGNHITRVDAGIGVSLLGRHFPDRYSGYTGNSRLSLVLSQKIGGNTQDKFAVHFRFGGSF